MKIMKTKISDKIVDAIRKNKAVPIIGAGVSYYYGYQNWAELLISLSAKYNIKLNSDIIKGRDYLQVAEALLQKGIADRNLSSDQIKVFMNEFNSDVIECIKKGYCSNKRDKEEITKINKLKNIDFQTIITTNYDDIIENKIFDDVEYNIIYPSAGRELLFDEYKPCIMKIHGDLNEPKSIILTQSQYYDFINSKGYFNSKLYTLFTTNIIIMIGYSFRDINIHDIYFKYRNEFKEYIQDMTPKAYMVVTDYDIKAMGKEYYEIYKLYLKGNGIEVIDAYKTIGDFIEELVNKVQEDKRKWDAYEHLKFDMNTNITYNILDSVIKGKKVSLNQIYTSQINKVVAEELCTLISMMLVKPLVLDEFSELWNVLDIERKLPNEICEELFELIKICIQINGDITSMDQYSEIVAFMLEYADQFRYVRNDFYIYPDKFRIFMDNVKYVKRFSLSDDLANSFAKKFSLALNYSGLDKGKCNGSADILLHNYSDIPSDVFEVYFTRIKKEVLKEIEHSIDEGDEENIAWINYKIFHKQEIYWLENVFVNNMDYPLKLRQEIASFVNEINVKSTLK